MTRHLIAGAAALAVLGFGFLLWNALVPRERDVPIFAPTTPTPPQTAPASPSAIVEETLAPEPPPTESACVPVPAPELPPFDDSDDFILTQVDACLAALFPDGSPNGSPDGTADILRRAAGVVENAARGELSRGRFALVEAPAGEFRTETRGDRHFIDNATFRRYDAVVDALTCMPPERIASLTRMFRPLLAQAMRELGLPEADVDAMVDGALAAILAVQFPALPVEVVREDALFRYADAEIEAASGLTRQLLRLGPDNLARLQRHAGKVRAALRRPPSQMACGD